MKKILLIAAVMFFSAYILGCGKKQALEESQEPLSLEAMSVMTTSTQTAPEVKPPEPKAQVPEAQAPAATPNAKLEPLPPAGPYKPSPMDIQTALKNAGFYSGTIDGKIGPKSKKAIEEFQKANGLKADGKVGPKTWSVLSRYLNVKAEPVVPAKR